MTAQRRWWQRIPGLVPVARRLLLAVDRWRLRGVAVEARFTRIVESNAWGGRESLSGPGSDLEAAAQVMSALPALLRELGVRRLLDLPCGDCHWLQRLDLDFLDYLGADIVSSLVTGNNARLRTARRRFVQLDMLASPWPRADLVLCRDALVHFSDADVWRALERFADSGADWLLTTSFPAQSANRDIATCRWRPLNLQARPFLLPEPQRWVRELPPEAAGPYADKSLALWPASAIRARLGR